MYHTGKLMQTCACTSAHTHTPLCTPTPFLYKKPPDLKVMLFTCCVARSLRNLLMLAVTSSWSCSSLLCDAAICFWRSLHFSSFSSLPDELYLKIIYHHSSPLLDQMVKYTPSILLFFSVYNKVPEKY